MLNKAFIILMAVVFLFLTGCASAPKAPAEEDQSRKAFNPPPEDKAGLYVYRNSLFGSILKKSIYLNGVLLGKTAPNTYFYKEITPGNHTLSTEAEFGRNDLQLVTQAGRNYYVKLGKKFGGLVGTNLIIVDEEEGMEGVLDCKLAN